jgi:nucleotide-binding universal stress UspA family protein
MSGLSSPEYGSAVRDFQEARQQAALEAILARLTGRSVDLLSYDEVRRKLGAREAAVQELKDVPIDAIVGSVGRYQDFTRSFLPKRDSDEDRWARVYVAVDGQKGLPPIELYQLGDAYFVRDGHHRVSVARQLGATHVQAYVTPVISKVPLEPEADLSDVILKAHYAEFIERTHLDPSRMGVDLSLTAPGGYDVLDEHIRVHRYFMGLEEGKEIAFEDAASHWYDTVYMPVIRVIRQQGILRDFPDRTEADLYLWVLEHRTALEAELGWEVELETAAADLVTSQSKASPSSLGGKLIAAMTPDEFEAGPPPGDWRRRKLEPRPDDRVFVDVLVPVSPDDREWTALTQAIEIARRESGRVFGLRAVPDADQLDDDAAATLRAEFDRRCKEAGIRSRFAVELGRVAETICLRAGLADLVVIDLAHPPANQPIGRLSSGARTLIQRCGPPILAVPDRPTTPKHVLLAYDGSPRAREALYLATYLTARWKLELSLLMVQGKTRPDASDLKVARRYLESHGVLASYIKRRGKVAPTILDVADRQGCDLILIGAYSAPPVLEVTLGSTVDELLRGVRIPVLICH